MAGIRVLNPEAANMDQTAIIIFKSFNNQVPWIVRLNLLDPVFVNTSLVNGSYVKFIELNDGKPVYHIHVSMMGRIIIHMLTIILTMPSYRNVSGSAFAAMELRTYSTACVLVLREISSDSNERSQLDLSSTENAALVFCE